MKHASRDDEAMTEDIDRAKHAHPVLLCFDGSDAAAAAIAKAGELLGPRTAVLLTVWEPLSVWEPYDPATILTAPVSKLASKELGLDEIAHELAREKSDRGVALARTAGFEVQGRVAKGKSWSTICDVAESLTPSRSWSAPAACRGSSRRSSAASLLLSSRTWIGQCSSFRRTAAERSAHTAARAVVSADRLGHRHHTHRVD